MDSDISHFYPVLRHDWVLRRDTSETILYFLSTIECRYLRLHPRDAIVISMFDGTKTINDLATIICDIFSISSSDVAKSAITDIITKVNKNGQIIELEKTSKETKWKYDSKEFIIDISDYKKNRSLEKPIRVMIFPTGKCQTECRYCYADTTGLRSLNDLPIHDWETIFKDISSNDIKIIDISGGDLFARNDSAEFINLLCKYNFLFFSSTKCLITEATAHSMVNSGFLNPVHGVSRDFQISIDGINEDTVAHLVGVKGYVKRAFTSISNLIQAGITPITKSVITPHNIADINPMINRLVESGVSKFNLSKYSPSFHRKDESLLLSENDSLRIFDHCQELRSKHKHISITGDASSPAKKQPENIIDNTNHPDLKTKLLFRSGCSAGRCSLAISPDGRAMLCEQMKVTEPFIFGNVLANGLKTTWSSNELSEICFPDKTKFTNSRCSSCPEFDLCIIERGYCFRDNYFFNNKEIYTTQKNCPDTNHLNQ